jgi:hypothetical protein
MEEYVKKVNEFVSQYWHFTIVAVALLFLLFACGAVANAKSPVDSCTKPSTISAMTEHATKHFKSTPDIYTADEVYKLIRWYNKSKFQARYGPFDEGKIEGAKHFLLVRNNNVVPLRIGPSIVLPRSYFAIVMFESGCAWGWAISSELMEEYKGREADAT